MIYKIINGVDLSVCDKFRDGYCYPGTGVSYKCDTNCQYACYVYKEQLQRKITECEELKAQNETYQKMLDDPKVRVALTDVKTGEREVWRRLGRKAQRYKQALDQIENFIINDTCEPCKELEENYCDECNGQLVLDIISKAKGDKND